MNYGGERTNVAEEEKNTREQANSDPGESVLFPPFRVWKMIITPTHSSILHFASHVSVRYLCLSLSRFDGVRRPRAAPVLDGEFDVADDRGVHLFERIQDGRGRQSSDVLPQGSLGRQTANVFRSVYTTFFCS